MVCLSSLNPPAPADARLSLGRGLGDRMSYLESLQADPNVPVSILTSIANLPSHPKLLLSIFLEESLMAGLWAKTPPARKFEKSNPELAQAVEALSDAQKEYLARNLLRGAKPTEGSTELLQNFAYFSKRLFESFSRNAKEVYNALFARFKRRSHEPSPFDSALSPEIGKRSLPSGTGQNLEIVVSLTQDRSKRPQVSSSASHGECPLCQLALGEGEFISKVSPQWAFTLNRYPGMTRELLVVHLVHSRAFGAGEILQFTVIAEGQECSVLGSSQYKSIPGHQHASATDQSLPIQSARTLEVKKGLHITQNWPAPSFVLYGSGEERALNAHRLIERLNELEIPFNFLFAPERTYIHPLKLEGENVKKIAGREFAGWIGTSKPDLYATLLSSPEKAVELLRKSSFSEEELKNLLSTERYSTACFERDVTSLTSSVRAWEAQHGATVSHVVGVTRGGIALAGAMVKNLGVANVSLAGCYFEKTGSGEEILHWKTPVGKIAGDTVLITTDLVRSGKILSAIKDEIQRNNPHVKTVLIAGLHYFEGNATVAPDFTAHRLGTDDFVSYPWEPDRLSTTHSPEALYAQKVSQALGRLGVTPSVIIGVGTESLPHQAYLSQMLSCRTVQAASRENVAYAPLWASDSSRIDFNAHPVLVISHPTEVSVQELPSLLSMNPQFAGARILHLSLPERGEAGGDISIEEITAKIV